MHRVHLLKMKEKCASMDKMRWMRVLVLATFYFFIYVASAVLFMIKLYSGSSELAWYFRNPWIALRTIFNFILSELPQNPLFILTLFVIILQSFILGFITEWGLRILVRQVQLRRGEKEK